MKLMARMKVCVSTKLLLLLCFCFIISTGQEVCDHSVLEGSSYTLPLEYGELTTDHPLQWKHDDTVLVNRKRGRFSRGSAEDIDQSGSLKLRDLQKTSSGNYEAEVYGDDGTLVGQKRWTLCVTEKVPKPSVNLDCSAKTVSLSCNVPQPQGLSFTWSENGEEVPDVNQMNLTRPVDTESTFTCTVSNPGDNETSDPFKPSCPKGQSPGQEACDHSVLEGSSYTLPLEYGELTIDHPLQWKHNDTVIVSRKRGRFSKGSAEDIDQSGSLKLRDLQKTSSGNYIAEVYDGDGQIVKTSRWNLCVTGQEVCDHSVLEGSSYTLPLEYGELTTDHPLQWKHDDTVLVNRKRRVFSRGSAEDIDQSGSLKLRDLQKTSSGNYEAEVYDGDGELVARKSWILCVTEKVPKPSVNRHCSAKTVTLSCNVPQPQGLTFTWSENGEEVPDVNQMNVTRPVDTESTFTCTVSNPGDNETSDPFQPSCPKGQSPGGV